MITLDRANIIDGLIELREEDDLNNKLIIDNIKYIIKRRDVANLDKLRLINHELGKIVIEECI